MKKTIAVVVALMMSGPVSGPAMAQTLEIMLPNLTYPAGDVTTSTKGCGDTGPAVCIPQK